MTRCTLASLLTPQNTTPAQSTIAFGQRLLIEPAFDGKADADDDPAGQDGARRDKCTSKVEIFRRQAPEKASERYAGKDDRVKDRLHSASDMARRQKLRGNLQ